jgi:hypothetical protein
MDYLINPKPQSDYQRFDVVLSGLCADVGIPCLAMLWPTDRYDMDHTCASASQPCMFLLP